MHDEHGEVLRREVLRHGGRRDPLAPAKRHEVHGEAQVAGGCGEARAEVSVLERQNAIARCEDVHERSLPRTGARGGIHDDAAALGLEDLRQVWQQSAHQRGERRPAVVDDRTVHRPQHAVGDVRRSGDLQERPSAHGSSSTYTFFSSV